MACQREAHLRGVEPGTLKGSVRQPRAAAADLRRHTDAVRTGNTANGVRASRLRGPVKDEVGVGTVPGRGPSVTQPLHPVTKPYIR
eukprot:3706731-Pyramimonas_sp.AAC.2